LNTLERHYKANHQVKQLFNNLLPHLRCASSVRYSNRN
jgi:hypothetical protein